MAGFVLEDSPGALNARLRKTLGRQTPAEALDGCPRSLHQTGVPTTPCTRAGTSLPFTDALTTAGIAGSIASLGDALDNALMDPTTGPYKTILIDRLRPRIGRAAVEREIAAWICGFNTERLHRPSPTAHR